MASAAAARLQDLLRGFVSHNPDHGVRKLVPDSCEDSPFSSSFATALDAAEVLEHLPFFVSHLRPLSSPHTTAAAATTMATPSHAQNAFEQRSFEAAIRFLGGVVERHLRTFAHNMSTGPFLARLDGTSQTSTSDTSASDAEGEDREPSGSAGLFACDGGPRVNFVAWVALEVYRHLITEAEDAARGRRARGRTHALAAAEVYSDEVAQWVQQLREQLASVSCGAGSLRGRYDSASTEEMAWRQRKVAAVLRSSLEDFNTIEDIFSSESHFFSEFTRTRLLPHLRQHVLASRETKEERSMLVRELRQWARQSIAFPTVSVTSLSEPCAQTTAPPATPLYYWKKLVQVLLGSSIAPALEGEGVYESSGMLRPPTPACVAAYAAAATATSLVPGVVSASTRWLDRCRGSIQDEGSESSQRRHVDAECNEAVHHALDVCLRSVQVVPFPLCDGRDADVGEDAQVAGGWLLPHSSPSPSSSSPPQVQRRDVHGSGVSCQRRVVVLPGLSIAATRIHSGAATQASLPTTREADRRPAADAATPAGTCVVSPAGALSHLLVGDAQLDAAIAAPCCDAAHASSTVSLVKESSLRSVEWLLLFVELPQETEQLARIRTAVEAAVSSGWVLFVVQASVPKATQSWIEAAWGSTTRPVLLLSAVGQWGMQHLSLRFDLEPNTRFTDPRALRGVRHGGRPGLGCCGVAALLLHCHSYAPSMTITTADSQRRPRRRAPAPFTELREQLLFVIGAIRNSDGRGDQSAVPPAGDLVVPPQKILGEAVMNASTPVAAAVSKPTMSMFHEDSTEEGSEEEEESDLDVSTSSIRTSGSSFSTPSLQAAPPSSRARAVRRMASFYGNPDLPPLPFVTRCVLIGAATRSHQRELTYGFWHSWRLLLHRLVLPSELQGEAEVQGGRSANMAALRYLDTVLATSAQTREKAGNAAEETPLPSLQQPRQRRALSVFREALWSYELLAKEQDGEGKGLDEAWAALQRWTVGADCPGHLSHSATAGVWEGSEKCNRSDEARSSASHCAPESWWQVQSAFVALGSCLDELCSTVVMGLGEAEGEGEAGTAVSSLSFSPAI